ncbi:MAG: helicase-related protein [bacterium]|nr:helicase-related protein [bacterium]
MANFITNAEGKDLKKRLIELVENSKELKFLVGFFYFSGIRELYEGLKNNPNAIIKILVGLDVDKANFGLIEYASEDGGLSAEEASYKLLRSVKKSLTSSDFDTEEFYEQVKYFIKLISEDKLIIRKTYHPNHAKIYLFNLNENQVGRKKLFITGSSNLTRAGLSTQAEFNVEISDFGVEDAENHFDALWSEAVKITEDDIIKSKLLNLVENDTHIKGVTPFEAFVLVLKIYLDSFEKKEIGQSLKKIMEENGYTPYQYQLDAVKQGLAMIEKNNGLVIADVVGLGKTIVACATAKELKKRGVVICPPGLVGDRNKTSGWKMYLEQFKLYDWEVRSLGDLEETAKFVNGAKDIEVIIIDEAHRSRNQDTKDYEYLKNICRNKVVILLTATPFNNRPGDILALLKLFITPKKSAITLENNLVDRFKSFKGIFDRLAYIKKHWNSTNESKRKMATSKYEGLFEGKSINLEKVQQRSRYLAKQIRDVIEPVTIRRNRLDLQNNPLYKDEVGHLSKVADPKEWFFELSKKQSAFYDKIIATYFGDPDEGGQFKGAIYRPFEYEVDKEKINKEKLNEKENFQFFQQRNLFDFMRRLMVKRFESSFGSFEQSIRRFKKITENALAFIEASNKYILDRPLLEKIYDLEEEEIEAKLDEFAEKLRNGDYPKNNRIYDLDKFARKDEFIADIKSDLALFDSIIKELAEMDLVKNDPKAECLLANIKDVLKQGPQPGEPKRKVIIFSEYLDTINHLERILTKHFGERMLVVGGDLSTSTIALINQNFDAAHKKPADDYDILLSTDRISEGFNLNRAGMIINYDIPWNPVRVIQRVGRINRISKKVFNDLFIVNFFPTEKGAVLVQSRQIASNKMFLIHNVLGEDAKIFDIDEEPTAAGLYERIQQNPDAVEEESFYTKALKTFLAIQKQEPQLIEALKNYPARVKVAKNSNENGLLVFFKKGRLYIHGIVYENGAEGAPYQSTFEEVFDKIVCDKDEAKLDLSSEFWKYYEQVKSYKEYQSGPVSENSLEQQAKNNISTIITRPWDDVLVHLDFVRTLREDIVDYGTLSDYTLRRIANMETVNGVGKKETVAEIAALKQELGEDYLRKEKNRQKDIEKEIIIAIENQKL